MSFYKFTNDKTTKVIKTNTILKHSEKPFLLKKTVEESIVMSIFNLADALTKAGDVHCQRFGVTMLQYKIMLHLAGDPNIEYIEENSTENPIVASELAEAMNVSRPNITNLLNLLVEKDLVSQVKKQDDWRKKFLILTEKGWALLGKMEPIRLRTNRRLLAHLCEKEKDCFLESLRTCLDLLNQK